MAELLAPALSAGPRVFGGGVRYKLITLHDRHPLWSIIRMGVLFTGCIGVLHITATHFDLGELRAAGVVGLLSVVFDMAKRQFTEKG